LDDSAMLDRSTALGRVLVTHDHDFIVEGVSRQNRGVRFDGVIHLHPMRMTIGNGIAELSLVALIHEPEEFENRIEYLPLYRGASVSPR
jgi:hypothetical protein